ncbi:hypothetical protein F5B21DRAFT_373859 [Xylaria acuta]|nr:hypothetical protein F5B21DRAFT_373859 [Xylaria acuta]
MMASWSSLRHPWHTGLGWSLAHATQTVDPRSKLRCRHASPAERDVTVSCQYLCKTRLLLCICGGPPSPSLRHQTCFLTTTLSAYS